MNRALVTLSLLLFALGAGMAQNPEPSGWYAGDMHAHRSCGGSPESVQTMFTRMTPFNLSVASLLADSGNGEVQDPATDLPLVNGQDDPVSTTGHILHWDAEWHWDATYSQYAHEALGGHIVTLGLSSAKQLWQEYTYPILDWAHQQNGIAGFAHMQYLDGNGLPSALTCCTPIEYPVEVALGAADFISEDVDDVNGITMNADTPIQAYYKLLNSGFRPSLAAGTDYPCNGADNGGALGGLLTYVQIPGGQLTYRDWIKGIANGRTVVSRNGHNEFLSLVVNGTSTPGDEIQLTGTGNVAVTVQWTAPQSWTGTIELVQNGLVVASKQATVGPGTPQTLTATINFTRSGWLAARRMGINPRTNASEHYLHTAAVFVLVNNAPIRTSQADAQYFVDWTNGLLLNTSRGGMWNSYFPTSLTQAQARYQAANALFQQIASEASGIAPALNSISISPLNQTIGVGSQLSFNATGAYSGGTTLNVTGQVRWSSSNPAVAVISTRGLVSALSPGSTTISAALNGITSSTPLTVTSTPLVISTQSLPGATVGVAYAATLMATGGTPPYAWSISSGSLPAGIVLNANTGALSGTPSAAGIFNIVVRASDVSSPVQVASQPLTISVVTPPACPCSIWPSTATPQVAAETSDPSAVELGVEFRSDIDGYITGVRFYKGATNTGTHVGSLWTTGGARLASATFTGESASGWQQVNFAAPVPITAGITYIASYHTNTGNYAYDLNYFAGRGIDNPPLHALPDSSGTPNGLYAYGAGSLPNQTWFSTNYWVDVVFGPPGPDTTPPTVLSVSPSPSASGVDPSTTITAAFSEALDPATVNGTSVQLLDSSSVLVPATVTYTPGANTVTLIPNAALQNSASYRAVIKGGAIRDLAGNALASDYAWTFTTAAPPPPPPTEGPGGPILIVSSSTNPFSRYLAEILRNEGLNEFTAMDISLVSASTLADYQVVLLGNFPLTAPQVSMFTTWVNNGGNLIAMRPDKQLASTLGLVDTGNVLGEGYISINTGAGPGAGLVSDTVQFHGNADRYTVNGATVFATLYSTATTATINPAVTLNQAGLGQAAAFTYDLARSVVYTRQGNPAWSGERRDGQTGPIRSDNLFFGNASFDPQPDYVDRSKIAIPQADEQQRLLANLIIQMNMARQPLPRFWYFPRDVKAAVVLTGDDHGGLYGGGATAARFDHYSSLSPAACSVSDWQCVRASAYLIAPSIATNPLTNTQAASYIAQGFEVGVHLDSVPDCVDWTPAELASLYVSQVSSFLSTYRSVPQPKTHRMHCIGWSDYDSQPKTELQNGIRLDTNYYYWPPSWVNDTPGMFTGSGMPMRFTTSNGTMLDIYQATTQMTDESGQSYPFTIDTLLDNALGANAYYGFFTANMHNDVSTSQGADYIIDAAQSRSVPIISAAQLLTWLDGRNGSSFASLSWNGSTLSFQIAVGSGANGLRAMLPANSSSGAVRSITLNGSAIQFTLTTIKGIAYAVFPASAGTYQASYATGTVVAIASVAMNPSTVSGGSSTTGTVTLNGPAPSGGALITLSSSDSTVATLASSTVTIPQGATSATFTVNTSSVTTAANVVISATYAGNTVSANLTVTPYVAIASVSLSPATVVGGTPSTGTVTLSQAAPSAGIIVNLSSSNGSVASVPASITVASGNTTATFSITTYPVSGSTAVTITTLSGNSLAASLTVNPPAVASLALSPGAVTGGTNSTATVTLSGRAPSGGAVVALSSSNSTAATVPATVTVAANSITATFVVTSIAVAAPSSSLISATYNGGASSTLTVNPPSAISVALNPTTVTGGATSTATVTLNGPAPSGGAVIALLSSNSAVATVPSTVTVPANSTATTFVVTSYIQSAATSALISAVYNATVSATLTVNPPSISIVSLTLSPTAVTGGTSSTGRVTLNGAAPAGGIVVTLQDNSASATTPASVTVAGGATSGTFTVSTTAVGASTVATITAKYGSSTATANLTINPPRVQSVSLSPTSLVGGAATSRGTVRLNGPAPSGGALVTLSSGAPAAASVPASVSVAANATTATFTVTSFAVSATTSATISATYNATSSAQLTVNPAALSSFTLSPTSVRGGSSSTGTVRLNGPAPAGGALITLRSGSSTASVPASVTIPAGSTSATFTVTTRPVSRNTNVSITATYRSASISRTLTVQ